MLLRCIAGLQLPQQGEISIGGKVMFAASRGIWISAASSLHRHGVFRSYAIWPHMSVFENIAFPCDNCGPKSRKKRSGRG